jgi:hypothetical protein
MGCPTPVAPIRVKPGLDGARLQSYLRFIPIHRIPAAHFVRPSVFRLEPDH